MAKKDRQGIRKTRDERKIKRVPELGYYIIVTDTEGTERCYFEGLRKALPNNTKDKLVIKVIETSTADLVSQCIEYTAYDPQYRIPWIVFDRDRVINFDKIIEDAGKKDINVGWSNPCFEIWMHAYYGKMPSIIESDRCVSEFARIYKDKNNVTYDKNDDSIYKRLIQTGDENNALKLAKNRYEEHIRNGYVVPSKMCPCTSVYNLVKEIRNKATSD